MSQHYDAIVLAGGQARRLGGVDKCTQDVGGRSLLAHALDAVSNADRTVVVGPRRPTTADVIWTREDPPGGGPVAATAAALDLLADARTIVLLAADLPFAATAVPRLLDALDDDGRPLADAAVLVDTEGRDQFLLAAFDAAALRQAVGADAPAGRAMKSVMGGLRVVRIAADGPESMDCDTLDDLGRARETWTAQHVEGGRR